MNSSRRDIIKKAAVFQMLMVLFICLNLAVPPGLMAQGAKAEPAKEGAPALRPEEIDQLMAPIALYPDALLAQVLTASTYPLEIVQAARLVQQNNELKGEKLMAAAKDKDWDPSVKPMLQFPDVLLMMNEKLEWTEKLGNAFLSQQKDVMASAQRLRQKAQESGNLKTTKEQVVKVEQQTQVIVIESANPQEGYTRKGKPVPYFGYYYKILKGQGVSAPGGAYQYVINGHMMAGFALVAWPAEYGVSGMMTFIVNQNGTVYAKDLGPKTEGVAKAMTFYNPHRTWKRSH